MTRSIESEADRLADAETIARLSTAWLEDEITEPAAE
jgi:hypothetical protein